MIANVKEINNNNINNNSKLGSRERIIKFCFCNNKDINMFYYKFF